MVGATGLVGEVLLDVLHERRFPVGELRAYAGAGSVGRRVRFGDEEVRLEALEPTALEAADLVFFAATGALSRELGPRAAAAGALVIDKSATWRLDPEVPLVVPEINPEALEGGSRLVACPNCTTIGTSLVLAPLERAAGLEQVVVTTLQSISGAGRAALEELVRAEADPESRPSGLARNAIPLCGALTAGGASEEERKLLDETRKILGRPDLALGATCVRVPVHVGHGASLWVRTRRPLSPEEATEILAAAPALEVVELPTPREVAGSDACRVGRVRASLSGEGLELFQVTDNLRKGAATNAVQIAEMCLP